MLVYIRKINKFKYHGTFDPAHEITGLLPKEVLHMLRFIHILAYVNCSFQNIIYLFSDIRCLLLNRLGRASAAR